MMFFTVTSTKIILKTNLKISQQIKIPSNANFKINHVTGQCPQAK